MKILVPIDGSRNSMNAGKMAVSIAKKTGAQLLVVNVIPTPTYAVSGSKYYPMARRHSKKWVDGVVRLARRNKVKAAGMVLESVSISKTLLKYAESKKVNMIVIGTRGLGTFKRLVMGSVSSAIVNHAHCAVLVVR